MACFLAYGCQECILATLYLKDYTVPATFSSCAKMQGLTVLFSKCRCPCG